MVKITKVEVGFDKESDQDTVLDNMMPLLRRTLSGLDEDLTPRLPADLIRRYKLKSQLFPDKEDD